MKIKAYLCNIILISAILLFSNYSQAKYTKLLDFNNAIGTYPNGNLISGGTFLYGMTSNDGVHLEGVIFKIKSPALAVTASQSNVSCYGACNGIATVNASGGTSPYTYSWAPSGGSGATASNLCAGTYTCTVIDAAANTVTVSVTITQPPLLMVTTSSVTNVTCNGNDNGSITVSASGGTTPYTYSWNPCYLCGDNPQDWTLPAGCYTVTVTDANGCTASVSACITQPPVLTVTICSQNNVTCNGGNNGCASICVTGGTPGYTYTWSNGATLTNACSLTAGTYTATVTDANGCTATAAATITEPPVLTITATAVNTTMCEGSCTDIDATGSGGTPGYNYSWSNGRTSSSINMCPVTTTVYTCAVSDANGCSNIDTAIVHVNPLPTIVLSGNDSVCKGNSTILSATGGGSYLWSNGYTTSSITVSPGSNTTYTLSVSNGTCMSDTTFTVVVNPLPTVNITIVKDTACVNWTTDALTGNPSGGTFSGAGVTGTNFNPNTAGTGTHTLTYTYTNGSGCSNSDSLTVIVSTCTGINELTVDNEIKIYPNPFNQSISVNVNVHGPVEITMYNMMGQSVGNWTMDHGKHIINTENYSSGVYMLQVKTQQGLMNKKLIKVN